MEPPPQSVADIPPFQLQSLIQNVIDPLAYDNSASYSAGRIQVRCSQALGSEIYVGCSNGELLRFALQADNPTKLESYTLLSRQTVPGNKSLDEIVLVPSLSRALVLSDHQIHFYTIPSLDPYPTKPIRHVVAFAADDLHLKRLQSPLSASGMPLPPEPVDFCVFKRTSIALYTMKDRLAYQREIPLPQGSPAAVTARRIGKFLCFADKEYYNMLDLETSSIFQVILVSQSSEPTPFVIKPSIIVINHEEFFLLSWTGPGGTIGLFITGDGDARRGTVQWPIHPESICLDYPYILSLLPDNTIETHSIEDLSMSQVIPAPVTSPSSSKPSSPNTPSHQRSNSVSKDISIGLSRRVNLTSSIGGYLVPSTERVEKMRTVPVRLLRS